MSFGVHFIDLVLKNNLRIWIQSFPKYNRFLFTKSAPKPLHTTCYYVERRGCAKRFRDQHHLYENFPGRRQENLRAMDLRLGCSVHRCLLHKNPNVAHTKLHKLQKWSLHRLAREQRQEAARLDRQRRNIALDAHHKNRTIVDSWENLMTATRRLLHFCFISDSSSTHS